MLGGIEMPGVRAPIIGVIAPEAKRLEQPLELQKHLVLTPATDIRQHLVARIVFEGMTGRNQDAIRKTAAGLLKLLYPHRTPENIEPEELQFCLELAVEMRRRVTDQLRVIAPKEFTHAAFTFHMNGR